MRCMAARTTAGTSRWSAPDRSRLEAVRHLGDRFPAARLREVPIVRAADLDTRADPDGDTRVWLALEALQVTGSFKVRGALVALEAHRGRGAAVAASGGNHGLAVAYAARVLGLDATVCVPRTASPAKCAKIERYGAELVVAESDLLEDVETLAREIARSRRSAYIAQCDDLDVVAGNGASLGFEIVRGLGGVPERVLAPYGGGLATGLSWALRAEARDRLAPASKGMGPTVWGVGASRPSRRPRRRRPSGLAGPSGRDRRADRDGDGARLRRHGPGRGGVGRGCPRARPLRLARGYLRGRSRRRFDRSERRPRAARRRVASCWGSSPPA